MISLKKAAAVPALAALAFAALVGGVASASAQDAYGGDAGAVRPALRAHRPLHLGRRVDRSVVVDRRDGYRPLTVARRRYGPAPLVVARPAYNPYVGPTAIVTGPIAIASTAVSLPFRILGDIFPPVGPAAIVGAPIQAAGQIAQVPFMIAEAPFGAPGPFAY